MAAKIPSRRTLTPEQRDYRQWPQVDVERLAPASQREFLRRRDAVTAYLDGCSEKTILTLTRTETSRGFRRDQVLYYLGRCLKYHTDGQIWGYRGLVPNIREKDYCRTKPIPNPPIPINSKGGRPGYAGVLGKYLRDHPEVRDGLRRKLLNKRSSETTPEQNPGITTSVFGRFLKLAEKIDKTEYPHNVDERGRRSIATFAKSLFVSDTKDRIASTEGPQAASRWEHDGTGLESSRATRPYKRVEIDFHKIDAQWEIEIPHPLGGDPLLVETDRINLIAVLDTNTRASLGYRISLNAEPNAGDVLAAIDHALSVWVPRQLCIPSLFYPEESGFPSGVIPECAHALWDQTFFDNAWSNLAYVVTDGLMDVVGSSVNVGIAGVPDRRPFIERLFGLLEKLGFSTLPNTTGSHPKDAKKMDPAKMARRYRLTIAALYDIVDVVLATLNGREGRKGIGGRSPLQAMQYYVSDPDNLVRRLTLVDEKELMWLAERVTATVQANMKHGKRPYIDYMGAEYTNPILRDAVKLIGQKITLLVKPHKDIRSLLAFRSDGTELGYLKVRGHWADSPHNFQQRKLTNRLIRHGQIKSAAQVNPIEEAKAFFAQHARTSRRAATQLANFNYSVAPGDVLSDLWPEPTEPSFPEPTVKEQANRQPIRSNRPGFVG